MRVNYKVKTASEHDVRSHLSACDAGFIPPLSPRVDLGDYAKKIFDKAMTFEAWHDRDLIGLVAVYFNDSHGGSGYITSVSVKGDWKGKGVATALLRDCLDYARQRGIRNMALEVSDHNLSAIRLYEKFGFQKTETRGEMALMNVNISASDHGQ